MEEGIYEWKIDLQRRLEQKESFLGVTAESRAIRIVTNYYVYHAFYKDPEFKEKFWDKKTFEEMDFPKKNIP